MASRLDLNVDQGSTFRRVFVWQEANGTPIDLTGYDARLEVRTEAGGELISAFTTAAGGGLVIAAVAGEVTLTISATVSWAWTFRTAAYDLLLWNGTDDVRLIQGTVNLSPRVTVRP